MIKVIKLVSFFLYFVIKLTKLFLIVGRKESPMVDFELEEFEPIQIKKNIPECDFLNNKGLTEDEREYAHKFYEFMEKEIDPELDKLLRLNYLTEEPTQDKKKDIVIGIMKKLATQGYYSTVLNPEKYTVGRVMRNAIIAFLLSGGRWSDAKGKFVGGNWSVEMGRLAGGTLYCNPVNYRSNKAQKEKLLAPVARDGEMAASAMTEFEAGSDIKQMSTKIDLEGNEAVIRGKKVFITNGMLAQYIIVYGRMPTGQLGGVIVDTKNHTIPNLKVDRVRTYGMNDAFVSRLIFDGVRVPAENVLPGNGLDIAFHQLVEERLVISAEALGDVAKKILFAHSFAMQRRQFDHLLGQYQIIRIPITYNIRQLSLLTDSLITYAHWLDEEEGKTDTKALTRQTMGLKIASSELAFETSINCFRVMGGRGFIRQYAVPIGFMDAYCMIHGGGSNFVLEDAESRAHFKY